MLPRLAASVCSATTGISSFSCSAMRRTVMANGTKVISATSLVIAMLQKKGRKTRTAIICRVFFVRRSRTLPQYANSPSRCAPFITAIRLNRSASVSQSMADHGSGDSFCGTRNKEPSASSSAAMNTASRFAKRAQAARAPRSLSVKGNHASLSFQTSFYCSTKGGVWQAP